MIFFMFLISFVTRSIRSTVSVAMAVLSVGTRALPTARALSAGTMVSVRTVVSAGIMPAGIVSTGIVSAGLVSAVVMGEITDWESARANGRGSCRERGGPFG